MVIHSIEVSSPYTRKMIAAISALKGQGKIAFTQAQLAEQMNAKITTAFRRRISELARDGVVERFKFQTEKGGYSVAYQICEKWEQLPLPEFPF